MKKSPMKRITCAVILFSLFIYLCFAILPLILNWSLPTGGWDWLGFVGTIFGLLITAWGIITTINSNNQQMLMDKQLAVIPCLDANIYKAFDSATKQNVFKTLSDNGGSLINTGYIMIRNNSKNQPENFTPNCNIKVTNLGLSTAFSVETYIYKLISIDGVKDLDSIKLEFIADFYEKVNLAHYEYYENETKKESDWLIAPVMNLGISNEDQFNIVLDLSNIKKKYFSIIEFRYQDIYKNKYHQLLYCYFDNVTCGFLPISNIYPGEKTKRVT